MNTLITYIQPIMQQQFLANKQAIQGSTLEKYFTEDLVVPVEMVKTQRQSQQGLHKIFAPTVDDINNYLTNPYQVPVTSYGVLDDENGLVACITSRHFFPNVTTKMIEWWFTWHCNQDATRYSLWFPHAHIANTVEFPERLTDQSLSYAEKLYGNPNHIQEYIGDNLLDAYIYFDKPEKLGVLPETLRQGNYSFSASGWSQPVGSPFPGGLMLHLGREKEGGLEFISHYWIGIHREWSRISGVEGIGEKALQSITPQRTEIKKQLTTMAYEMSVHDMTEFTRLGQFLPELYAEFGNE